MNEKPNTLLLIGALCSLGIAITHVMIVMGGPEWYRFFGAGEEMARMAAEGLWRPTIMTLSIAAIFSVWGFYGISGAGRIRRLPFLKPVLYVIAAIYTVRGLGFIIPLLMESPWSLDFMIYSSGISLAIGLTHFLGIMQMNKD